MADFDDVADLCKDIAIIGIIWILLCWIFRIIWFIITLPFRLVFGIVGLFSNEDKPAKKYPQSNYNANNGYRNNNANYQNNGGYQNNNANYRNNGGGHNAAPSAPLSVNERLTQLKQLLDSGAITQDEYNETRGKIIGQV